MVYYLGPAGPRYEDNDTRNRNSAFVGRRGEWMTRGRPAVEVVRVISDRVVMVKTADGNESIVNCRDIRWLTASGNQSSRSISPVYRPAYSPTSPPFEFQTGPGRHPALARDPALSFFPDIMHAQMLDDDRNAAAAAAAADDDDDVSEISNPDAEAPSYGTAPSGNADADSADSQAGTAAVAAPAQSSITCFEDGNLEVCTKMHKSDLECVVCYEPLVGKVFQCMLGAHNICQNCRDSIRSSGRDVCPMDRTGGGFIPNPRLEKEIATLTKRCKYSACSAKVLPWTMDAHDQVCQFGPFSCPLCQKQVSAAAEAASSDVRYFEQHLRSGQCSAQYQPVQDDQSSSGIKLKLVPQTCYYAVDPLNYLLFTPVPLPADIPGLLYQVRALSLSLELSKSWNSIKLEYLHRADSKSVTSGSSTEVVCWQRGGSSQVGMLPTMLVLPSLETGIKVEFSSIAKFQVGDKIHAVHRDRLQWTEADVVDVNAHSGEIYVRLMGSDDQPVDHHWMSQNSDQIIAPFRADVNPRDLPEIQQQSRRQRNRR